MTEESIKRKWWEFHKQNPEVYNLFRAFTWQLIRAGHSNYSAKGVFERIRWHTDVDTSGEKFKLCNNYTPYYARLFMYDYPEHVGFFRTKRTRDDS